MTKHEVIARLKSENRAEVARATGLPYSYLSHLVYEDITNPGSAQMDRLRTYFLSKDVKQERRA